MAKEILAIRMLTLHNIHFFLELAQTARKHILEGNFTEWKKNILQAMTTREEDDE
jgi:queuine tRNA-ribosyltransferase